MGSPEAVEDGAVGMEPDHAVLHRHPVQKGLLVVQEVGVRQPQLVSHPVVQGQVEREVVVGQAFVPPALLEVHGDGVILGETGTRQPGPLQLQHPSQMAPRCLGPHLQHFVCWGFFGFFFEGCVLPFVLRK